MKTSQSLLVPLLMATATVLAVSPVAASQMAQTPIQPNPLIISGLSGGERPTSCGFIPSNPSQVVSVNKAMANLTFQVTGGGEPTLFISGPNGQTFCIPADSGSGGRINVPGLWEQGNYYLFVGNRQAGNFPFTLSIVER